MKPPVRNAHAFRPGMLMRKRLNALLDAHGEREVSRWAG
jgi:hypothetical protein